eukprot:6186010-Pleurochrysis_carterae.AAC.4
MQRPRDRAGMWAMKNMCASEEMFELSLIWSAMHSVLVRTSPRLFPPFFAGAPRRRDGHWQDDCLPALRTGAHRESSRNGRAEDDSCHFVMHSLGWRRLHSVNDLTTSPISNSWICMFLDVAVRLRFQAISQTLHIINCHQHTETADFIGSLRPARGRALQLAEISKRLSVLERRVAAVETASSGADAVDAMEVDADADADVDQNPSPTPTAEQLSVALAALAARLEAVGAPRPLAVLTKRAGWAPHCSLRAQICSRALPRRRARACRWKGQPSRTYSALKRSALPQSYGFTLSHPLP